MEQQPPIILTGRTFVALQLWADPALHTSVRSELSIKTGATSPESHRPICGDVRLTPTFEAARAHNGKATPCSGTVSGVVFDGLIWQRFDLRGFTGSLKFSTPAELQGVLVWLRHVAAQAEGKVCEVGVAAPPSLYRLRPEKSERA